MELHRNWSIWRSDQGGLAVVMSAFEELLTDVREVALAKGEI